MSEGLLPYRIADRHPVPNGTFGIWLWSQRPLGLGLGGVVLQKHHDAEAWDISLLRTWFRLAHTLGPGWELHHTGTFHGHRGNDEVAWQYHQGGAFIVTRPIAPTLIAVERRFDLGTFFS